MKKAKLDFLVVGTAKAATTSLFYYLKQHENICLPTKETFFFISELYQNINKNDTEHRNEEDIVYDIDSYFSLMNNCDDDKVVGEIGTGYLYHHKTAIPNIKKYVGDPKIIIILRNPIDRAFSNYMHFIRNNSETLSFEDSLDLEEKRKNENWDFMWFYKSLGLYSEQVKAYIANFSNVKVVLYEDLQSDSDAIIKDITSFLEVPNYSINTKTKHNISGELKNNFIVNFLFRPHKLKIILRPLVKKIIPKDELTRLKYYFMSKNFVEKRHMSEQTRKELTDFYKSDIIKLEEITNMNLEHWYK